MATSAGFKYETVRTRRSKTSNSFTFVSGKMAIMSFSLSRPFARSTPYARLVYIARFFSSNVFNAE